MKNLTKFVVGLAIGATTLTACGSSWKEVSFDEWASKAEESLVEFPEDKTLGEMTFKVTDVDDGYEEGEAIKGFKCTVDMEDPDAEIPEEAYGALLTFVFCDITMYLEQEYEETSYFVKGSEFKAVDHYQQDEETEESYEYYEDVTYIFDKYGFVKQFIDKGYYVVEGEKYNYEINYEISYKLVDYVPEVE